jgi:hypothetical protein
MTTTSKKITYKSETLALPPLRMVLGSVPDPDPSGRRRSFRRFGDDKTMSDIKSTLVKLIGHLKDIEE